MAGTLTKMTNLAADLQNYMTAETLKRAKYQTVLDQFGKREEIPAGNSKTIQFTQYQDLAIVVDPLTEGVAPAGSALQTSSITADMDQYGDFITVTDLADLTPKHRKMQEKYRILGTQAARSLDRAIYRVLVAGTAVRYAGAKASRAALTATDVITMADITKEVVRLRNSGSYEFTEVATRKEQTGEIETKPGDGNFVCVIDASVEQDLMKDDGFAKASALQNQGKRDNELYKGRIVTFGGVTFVRTNNLPTVAGTSGLAVHTAFIFGMDAYANTDLQKLKVYKQGPGSVADPLEQIMTLGWKYAGKACILNNNWMGRIEGASNY